MIYTLTLNPAIDVSLHVKDGLMPGSINKSYAMRSDPGGKGINVARIYRRLGIHVSNEAKYERKRLYFK